MIGRQQKPAWTCLMYSNAARPKAYIIMWLMMNQKLSTVDRLVRQGLEVDKTCVLCKKADETTEHLFPQCQFARMLWESLMRMLKHRGSVPMAKDQFQQWCVQHGKAKRSAAQMFKTVITDSIYGLWIERNNRIFEKKSRKEESIVKEIACVSQNSYCQFKDVFELIILAQYRDGVVCFSMKFEATVLVA